jgi:predicted nucleic acid-binding protein
MTRAFDATVLAYAVNRFVPEHPRAVRVLEELMEGEVPAALAWPSIHEFLARVTHAHAVVRPLRPAEALRFVEQVLSSPQVRAIAPGPGHAAALRGILEGLETQGLPPGLEVAAVLREHGVRELLSADRGMRRYRFLDVVDPFHGDDWTPRTRPARRYRVLTPRVRRARGG